MSAEAAEVLIVEDSPSDAELTVRALRRFNLSSRVRVVESGADALDYVFARGAYAGRDQRPPRLVLLDLKLRKVSGLEVLGQLRAAPETRLVPVVMFTSSREQGDVEPCWLAGANSYVAKPVNADAFEETVAAIGHYWLVLNRLPPDSPAAEAGG